MHIHTNSVLSPAQPPQPLCDTKKNEADVTKARLCGDLNQDEASLGIPIFPISPLPVKTSFDSVATNGSDSLSLSHWLRLQLA